MISIGQDINRIEFCECSFPAGSYCVAYTILFCQDNAATIDGLFIMYFVFNKFLFDCLKAYHQISSIPDMEQGLRLLTCDVPSYDLPGLNVKIPEKPLSRKVLMKDISPINSKLKQTLT